MSDVTGLESCLELNFTENMTLWEAEDQMWELYTGYYQELTGRGPEIGDTDTVNLLTRALCTVEYQTMQYADAEGRMKIPRINTGSALDALAAPVGLIRKASERVTASVRFNPEEPKSIAVAILVGTRVETEDGGYFNSLEYAEIKMGESYADVVVQAEEARAESSGILSGVIKVLVDPIPYISGVSSTAPSTGGPDIEDGNSLTRYIYLVPSIHSCAEPRGAYEYRAREWRRDVVDIHIVSPQLDEVNIYFVIEDETGPRLPNPTGLAGMVEHMDGETIRPLCDHASCLAPGGVDHTMSFTYWVVKSSQRGASEIQSKMMAVVRDFQMWQQRPGRDINPTELIARLWTTGTKRVELTAPADIAVQTMMLPKCTGVTVTYGGLEDD